MSRRKKKKSILQSTFYRIYFACIIIAVIAIIIGTNILNGTLKDYESSQPIHVAADTVRLFENGDYDKILGLDTSMKDVDPSDRSFYVERLRELTTGKKIDWSELHSGNENEKTYRVTLDGEKFADFCLIPSGITTKHGNRIWTLGSITSFVSIAPTPDPTPEIIQPTPTPEPTPEPRTQLTITIPSESTVTVDGNPLTDADVVARDIPTSVAGLLPESIPAPTLTKYAFYSESNEPQIVVIDKYGNNQEPVRDSETSWSCGLPETPGLREKVDSSIITIAQKLAAFSSKDAKKGAITQYCASKSPAKAILNDYDPQWGTSHKANSFENIVTSDYYMYNDSCFSCHISFDYVATFRDNTVKTYPTAYTFFFVLEKGKAKLYNFTLS